MKVNTVLLSTTPDRTYYYFWNQLSYIYRTRFGIYPHLAFLGTSEQLASCGLSEKYGKIHIFNHPPDVHVRWSSPWAIFHLATVVDPDSVCLTMGIDQIPLSQKYLDTGDTWDGSYHIGLPMAYGKGWRENKAVNVPSSWHIARARTFVDKYRFESTWADEIRKLDNISDLNCTWGGEDQHLPGGVNKWGLDESYSTMRLRESPDGIVDLWSEGAPRLNPIDVYNGRYKHKDIKNGVYMDAHIVRPTDGRWERSLDQFLRMVSDTEINYRGNSFIHDDADIENTATIGSDCRIWDFVKIRDGAKIGDETIVGRMAFIDSGVEVGSRCKIGNGAQLFAPAVVGDEVFIGPGALLTNDRHPRACNEDGTLKGSDDWVAEGVTVMKGASIGAGAVVLGGVTIGEGSMIGAGAVVTRDVPSFSTVVGIPASSMLP